MALFVATASIHIFPDLKANDMQEYHRHLDTGINEWIHQLDVSNAGSTIVDVSFSNIADRTVLITVSYRSSIPSQVSLQAEIDKAMEGRK